MDQFAVFHITKFKKLGGIGAHIDRKHIASNVSQEKIASCVWASTPLFLSMKWSSDRLGVASTSM